MQFCLSDVGQNFLNIKIYTTKLSKHPCQLSPNVLSIVSFQTIKTGPLYITSNPKVRLQFGFILLFFIYSTINLL